MEEIRLLTVGCCGAGLFDSPKNPRPIWGTLEAGPVNGTHAK